MLMRPTWLFEADVFGQTAEPLKAEVRRQGMWCHVTRQGLLARGGGDAYGGHRIAADDCVVACGCYPFVRFVQDNRRWVPGAWCSLENLACSAYYPHFRPYLLNRRHRITTAIEAVRDQDALFAALGRAGRVFVRPDGCQKVFTGRVVAEAEFRTALAPARYDPDTRVVVAEPRAIAREWRLIVAEGVVIAASRYLVGGEIRVEAGCPADVLAFAAEMLAAVPWRPDAIFMADVCESGGGLYLLELNGFSCSAVYPCDYRAVVAGAGDLAIRAWERRAGADPGGPADRGPTGDSRDILTSPGRGR
jgi:ATP-grasp domain, R2K clade family 3